MQMIGVMAHSKCVVLSQCQLTPTSHTFTRWEAAR